MLRYAILQALFIIQFYTKKAHSTACSCDKQGKCASFFFLFQMLIEKFYH